MQKKYKISVAMATFNGEKYIKEQLESICCQTIKPDEIIISDDGSKDHTIDIINEIKSSYSSEINISILINDKNHGVCGNFSNALLSTTGDLIFLSDQDDIWYPDKIERIVSTFVDHPGTLCVMHEYSLIDGDGNVINDVSNKWTKANFIDKGVQKECRVSCDDFLTEAVSKCLTNGMALCIHKQLLSIIFPYPKFQQTHDPWIEACAVCADKCMYNPLVLTQYRLHTANTVGIHEIQKKSIKRILSKKGRLSIKGITSAAEEYYYGKSLLQLLQTYHHENSEGYRYAMRLYEIGEKEMEAVSSGRITGFIKLINLYISDIRYRKTGFRQFAYQAIRILRYSRSERQKILK